MLAGRPHRANGEVALHVVEAMEGFLESAAKGRSVKLTTTCERPEAVPSQCGDTTAKNFKL
jgi:hypothetical protein